jgi:hypothetical protein
MPMERFWDGCTGPEAFADVQDEDLVAAVNDGRGGGVHRNDIQVEPLDNEVDIFERIKAICEGEGGDEEQQPVPVPVPVYPLLSSPFIDPPSSSYPAELGFGFGEFLKSSVKGASLLTLPQSILQSCLKQSLILVCHSV